MCSFLMRLRQEYVVSELGRLGSLAWAVMVEILPLPCPLTPAANWFRSHAGLAAYQGGFLLHYLDALVYPDVSPGLLTLAAVTVCVFNLGVYAVRFRGRRVAGGKSEMFVVLLSKNRVP